MASVKASELSKEQKDELCVSYAALMLHDDGLEITVSNHIQNFQEIILQILRANLIYPFVCLIHIFVFL